MIVPASSAPSLMRNGRLCCSGWRGWSRPWATRCWRSPSAGRFYELTNSAFDLDLIGLIQFLPAVVLTLLIGHAADRYDRRLIVRAAQGAYALAAAMITMALLAGGLSRELLFGAVFMIGCARVFELPTAHALAPTLVPAPLISRAVAAWTSANRPAVICGPALAD